MKFNLLFFLYQWLIAFPILAVVTVVVALLTMILSPILPNCSLSYYPARWWGRVICYMFFIKVKLHGIDKLDPQQSCVIVANHQSMFDIFAIYGWLPHIFKWIMKAELRRIPFIGPACAAAGHIFIDRSNPLAAKKSLDIAEQQLKNGVSVVIFPEGTRTKTGAVGKFKKGAFRLATDLSLPIVPVTIKGSFERMKRSSVVITPGTIDIFFHDPVDVTQYDHEKLHDLMSLTHQIIESKL